MTCDASAGARLNAKAEPPSAKSTASRGRVPRPGVARENRPLPLDPFASNPTAAPANPDCCHHQLGGRRAGIAPVGAALALARTGRPRYRPMNKNGQVVRNASRALRSHLRATAKARTTPHPFVGSACPCCLSKRLSIIAVQGCCQASLKPDSLPLSERSTSARTPLALRSPTP